MYFLYFLNVMTAMLAGKNAGLEVETGESSPPFLFQTRVEEDFWLAEEDGRESLHFASKCTVPMYLTCVYCRIIVELSNFP